MKWVRCEYVQEPEGSGTQEQLTELTASSYNDAASGCEHVMSIPQTEGITVRNLFCCPAALKVYRRGFAPRHLKTFRNTAPDTITASVLIILARFECIGSAPRGLRSMTSASHWQKRLTGWPACLPAASGYWQAWNDGGGALSNSTTASIQGGFAPKPASLVQAWHHAVQCTALAGGDRRMQYSAHTWPVHSRDYCGATAIPPLHRHLKPPLRRTCTHSCPALRPRRLMPPGWP